MLSWCIFWRSEDEEGVNLAIAVFRRKASNKEAMLGLNSLKIQIKIRRVAIENQWIEWGRKLLNCSRIQARNQPFLEEMARRKVFLGFDVFKWGVWFGWFLGSKRGEGFGYFNRNKRKGKERRNLVENIFRLCIFKIILVLIIFSKSFVLNY